MQRFGSMYSQPWYISLPIWQKELVRTTLELYAREERMESGFTDYAFVLFPMAKAYEGFLKSFFYNTGLITRDTYTDKRFRIGKALNPDVHPSRRDEFWLFGRLADMCGSELSRQLWDVWLECRNQVFHYFPDKQKKFSLLEIGKYIEMIAGAMEIATQCRTE
jgi:hypothetical protein